MKSLAKAVSGGTALLNAIGLVLLLLMIVHVTLDVTLRYLLNMPLTGTIMYVSLFYMIAVAFLPLAAAEERDAQISVEVLTELLPTNVQSAFGIFSAICSALVFGALAVRTGQEALTKFRIGSFVIEAGTRIPTWPTYFILPIGFGMVTIVVVYKLFTRSRRA